MILLRLKMKLQLLVLLEILFYSKRRKIFNSNLGSGVSKVLFENMDEITASVLQDEIKNTIDNYEPRVNLISVDVSPNYDTNEFYTTINYNIVGIDVLPQQLSFALQPTR